MKKIVSLLIAVMMISTVAFGAVSGPGATSTYKKITVTYTESVAGEQATVLVYRVGDDEKAPDFDEAKGHKIVGVNQEASDGTFEIVLDNPDYTGYLVAAVGSASTDTAVKTSIKVVGGVPETIKAPLDCKDGSITIPSGETLKIDDFKILNAIVETIDDGTVQYKNNNDKFLDLSGKMYFDADGNINPVENKSVVKLELAASSDKAVGFIWNDTFVETINSYAYTVTDGADNTVNKSFDIPEGLSGNVRFAVTVTGVPAGANLTLTPNGAQ